MSNKHLENIELRSEEVQEILTKAPNWILARGNYLLLFLVILLLTVSWYIKYPDIISSETIITTQIPPQKEYARVSGKIDTIFVDNQDTVLPNQLLCILENSANYTDVLRLKKTMDTSRIYGNSFDFPIRKLPILLLGEIESDFALFENSYLQYKLNIDLKPFSNEATANRSSLLELKGRLTNYQAQETINIKELDLLKNDLIRYKSLLEKGVIATVDYERKQLEYLQAERNYKNMILSISQIREAIGVAKKNSIGTEITREKEEIIYLKSVIQSYNKLKNSIKDWEMAYVLKSNIEGRISFMNFWSKNQNVQEGDLVFTIVPTKNSKYIAKLKAPVENSGKITKGQTVNISLKNYPDTEFGMIVGRIEDISLTPDVEGQYLVNVALPSKLITTYNKEIEFKQEMQGTADIVTEDLRLIERFFYQFRQLFDR